uniref:Uncharacterized protein n=1 Tax=Fagus sylvatica TaxID=28930 RepID=A0A2N9GFL5_FAGSY
MGSEYSDYPKKTSHSIGGEQVLSLPYSKLCGANNDQRALIMFEAQKNLWVRDADEDGGRGRRGRVEQEPIWSWTEISSEVLVVAVWVLIQTYISSTEELLWPVKKCTKDVSQGHGEGIEPIANGAINGKERGSEDASVVGVGCGGEGAVEPNLGIGGESGGVLVPKVGVDGGNANGVGVEESEGGARARGEGGDEEGRRGGSGEGRWRGGEGRRRGGDSNLRPIMDLSKLTKMSFAITAQTTASVVAFHFSALSSSSKVLLVSVVVCDLVGYLCCMTAILLIHGRPRIATIFGGIGSAATALGFLLMIAMFLPSYLAWIVGLVCSCFIAGSRLDIHA